MAMSFINGNVANFFRSPVPNNDPPPPSDPKSAERSAENARIEAAKVLGDFTGKIFGFNSNVAVGRENLEDMRAGFYHDRNGNVFEVPKEVQDAAKLVLDDNTMFDRTDSNNDNLLAVAEFFEFADTNSVLNRFPI